MSYQGPKPFGRRRTDKSMTDPERRQLQMIRRDVDEDESGTIRRYMRLAARILGRDEGPENARPSSKHAFRRRDEQAA
ncbi:MAG: hypothetical protein JOZ44_08440 [Acidobacteria bacterium]|nr:hypothetical protein [Acidobacteriota bacterium]